MRAGRTAVVLVALALGLVAGSAAYLYLEGVQSRAYHNAALVPVYEVTQPIARGTAGTTALSNGAITKAEIPRQFRPEHAVNDLASIRGEVAASDLSAGQVVVDGLFGQAATIASTAAQAIAKGDVAITISVDDVHGVAGLIQPGDEVDIFIGLPQNGDEAALYQNVPVLAVGASLTPPSTAQTTSTATGSSSGSSPPTPSVAAPTTSTSGLVTFAVPPDAAARIALAEATGAGNVYLALVPPGNTAVPVPELSPKNFIPTNLTP